MDTTPSTISREILEVIPAVMRAIRGEMRAHRGAGLSIPQFRALLFINRAPGASLAQLAEHLGLTPATTSKMVDGLVGKGLVNRGESMSDRRRITLALSDTGSRRMENTRKAAQVMLDGRIASLDEAQKAVIGEALRSLRSIFMS